MVETFAKTIKQARLTGDMSLRDISQATGLDHSYIGRLEKGGPVPSRATVSRLAKALSIPENELLLKAGYVPRYEKEQPPEQVMRDAVAGDPDLLDFLDKLVERDDLKLLFKQTKDLSPEAIKRIIKYIKMVEDEEAAEDS